MGSEQHGEALNGLSGQGGRGGLEVYFCGAGEGEVAVAVNE